MQIDAQEIYKNGLLGESIVYELEDGNKITIKPKKLREIFNVGWSKYQSFNASILFSKERYLEGRRTQSPEDADIVEKIFEKLSSFQTLLVIMSLEEEKTFKKTMQDSYSFFLNCDVEFDSERSLMVLGFKDRIIFVKESDFNNIAEILKIQNKLLEVSEKKEEPKYDMAREGVRKLLERQRIAREKLARAKNKDAQTLDFIQMVGLMATIKSCFISDILDSMYLLEFYQQFDLYNKKSQYELGVQRLLAGDKAENVKLEHWFY